MKKAAVIGLGTIAPIHLNAIARNPEIRLVGVCDTDESTREKAPGGIPFFSSHKALLAAARPDCVHLCLPHDLHYPVAEDAVELGCDVLTEKPLAVSLEQALQFAELERSHPERRIGVCLQNRLNRTTETLKAILDSGEYGKVTGARGIVPWFRGKDYYEAQPWRGTWARAGSGVMMNQAVHTLDLLQYLCGPVRAVHGAAAQLLDYGIEVEDTVSARLEFESGARGVFWATNANFTNESVQIVVAAERAVFTIADSRLTRKDPDGTAAVLCEDARLPGSKFYFGASHSRLIDKFYQALEAGGDDYIHARDAVASIRLIDGILRSQREKTPVSLL